MRVRESDLARFIEKSTTTRNWNAPEAEEGASDTPEKEQASESALARERFRGALNQAAGTVSSDAGSEEVASALRALAEAANSLAESLPGLER